jgi:hypothetical protein
MPRLTNTSERGRDFCVLANAINALRDAAACEIQMNTAGTLSVQTGLHTVEIEGAAYLDQVTISVSTAPTGSDLIVDVLSSIDGTHFSSTTGGLGIHIPAGQLGPVAVTSFANPVLEGLLGGSPFLRVDILQIGSSVAGAGLLTVLDTGPF